MSKVTQSMDVEICIYGMVKVSEEEDGLAAAQMPEQEPEYWDVSVMAYPEGFAKDHYVLVEIEDITKEQMDPCLMMLRALFPKAEEESI